MLEVPCWQDHKRGKNWMAIVKEDPSKPGGLDRSFVSRAYGEFYYQIASVKVGDRVEFGADYYTTSGRKNAERWYGVVISVGADAIEFERRDRSALFAPEVTKDA